VFRSYQLFHDHAGAWAADWPLPLHDPRYCRGFLDPVALPAADFPDHAARLAERMPLAHLRFIRARDRMPAVAACPQLALARRLTLAGEWAGSAEAAALAASPHLANLERLDLSANQITARGAAALAAARMPALRDLRIGRNPLKDRGLVAIAQAGWPALEHLDASDCGLRSTAAFADSPLVCRLVSLRLASSRLENNSAPPTAWARLVGVPFARLERLDLSGTIANDDVAEALAANPALATLRDLDLGATWVTARGARALLDAPHLRGLRRLRLPLPDWFDAGLLAELRAAFGDVSDPRRDPARASE
jgi:hypothetical protein